jgi:glycosyltransferase involved in cell wall biosynthesis
VSGNGRAHSLQPIVFIDDAHTFGGAQIALAWAIRSVLRHLPQPVVCICTAATREAIRPITGVDEKLRFIDCPPALPLNLFSFPLRLRSFYKLLAPLAREGVLIWWLNLAGIEFCLAPLFVLRFLRSRPVAWLHNNDALQFYSAKSSTSRKLVSRVRDAVANRWLFGLYPLIVTPSHAAEKALKTRFHGGSHPRTGFLHPHVGLLNGTAGHQSEKCASAEGTIDLWMIGRVEYVTKNNLAALEVLKYLHRQGKAACLTVVGDGQDMAHFRKSVEELGLSDFVKFMGWVENPWQSVPDDAILFIASVFESMSLVAREAMLYGVRMVLSPVPVFLELMPNELIAHNFDEEALVEKVGDVFALSRERVLALYAEVLQKFTEEAFVAKFESFLQAAKVEEHQLPQSIRTGRN